MKPSDLSADDIYLANAAHQLEQARTELAADNARAAAKENIYVIDDYPCGEVTIHVQAEHGQTEESEVRGGRPAMGYAAQRVWMVNRRGKVEITELLTDDELRRIEEMLCEQEG